MIEVQEIDPFGGLVTRGNLLTLVDSADSNNVYIGQAQIGTATDAASWQILKIITSGTTVSVKYAGGTDLFTKVWNDRASYTYS